MTRICYSKGLSCAPALCEGSDTAVCNTQPCEPCEEPVSSSTAPAPTPVWSPWHACSVSCGGGVTYRDCVVGTDIVDSALCEGEAATSCNTDECPVVESSTATSQPPDGTASESSTAPAPVESSTGEEEEPCVGAWGPWSDCSAECGCGEQTRCCFFNGKQVKDKWCEGDSKRDCNTDACAPPAESSTAPAEESSSTAPAPIESSTAVSQPPDGTASESSTGEEEEPCVGAWGPWSDCSAECGCGEQTRCCFFKGHQVKDKWCDGESERECNTDACAPPAESSTGAAESSTATSQPPDGTASESSTGAEEEPCVGAWGPWSDCSAECGCGEQTRCCFYKGKQVKDKWCEGESERECNTDACVPPVESSTGISQPPDGTGSESSTGADEEEPCVGAWGPWSDCSRECGCGEQTRCCFYKGHQVKSKWCEGESERECNTDDCAPPAESSTGAAESSTASATGPDGTASESSTGEEEEPCVGAWGPWSDCSRSCDGGKQSRCCFFKGHQVKDKWCEGRSKRFCNTDACAPPAESSTGAAESSTAPAPGESSTAPAESSTAPTPTTGTWGDFFPCSVSCGGGVTFRFCYVNGVQTDASFCEGPSVTECNTEACAVESSTATSQPPDGTASESSSAPDVCVPDGVSSWSRWSDCSASCDGGIQTRKCVRSIKDEDCGCDGKDVIVDDCYCLGGSTRACNTEACPQIPDGTGSESSTGGEEVCWCRCPCQPSFPSSSSTGPYGSTAPEEPATWSAWHACSVSCGGGQTYRDCVQNGMIVDNSFCSTGNATTECNTEACPIESSTAVSQPPDGTASEESSTGKECGCPSEDESSTASSGNPDGTGSESSTGEDDTDCADDDKHHGKGKHGKGGKGRKHGKGGKGGKGKHGKRWPAWFHF